MTWICKKCGQIQPYSIIYSDGICDDCFEKINKKKKKGSAFNKIFLLALVLSFMLCIFSGFGVASAEDVTYNPYDEIKSEGTYLDYDVIKFDSGDIISWNQLRYLSEQYYTDDSSLNALAIFLVDFDESGTIHYYSYNSFGIFIGCNLGSNFSVSGNFFGYSSSWFPYSYVNFSYNQTALIETYLEDGKTEPVTLSYDILYTDREKEFAEFKGIDRYLVFVPYNTGEKNVNSIISELVTGTQSDLSLRVDSVDSKAKFNCFGNYIEYTYDYIENTFTRSAFKSKIVTDEKWGRPSTRYYFKQSSGLSSISIKYASRYISFSYFNGGLSNDGVTVRVDAIESFVQRDMDDVFDIDTWVSTCETYTPSVLLYSSDSMNNVPSGTTVYYKMDIANALNGLIGNGVYQYVVSIYQNSNKKLLTSTVFSYWGDTNKGLFGFGSIGLDGTGVIESSIDSTMIGDKTDDITLVPDSNGNMQDDLLIRDESDIEGNKLFGIDFDSIDFSDLTGQLYNATQGLGDFFTACLNIIPGAFITILTGSFTLIVILRVLGR